MTFKGIIGALNGKVKEGSSLYVFTDAKDPHQLVTARVLAMKIRLSIYFFTTGLCGSSEEGVLGISVLRFWLFFRSVLRWRACVSNNARDFDLAMWNTYVDQFANYGFQLASRTSNRRSSRTSRSNCLCEEGKGGENLMRFCGYQLTPMPRSVKFFRANILDLVTGELKTCK